MRIIRRIPRAALAAVAAVVVLAGVGAVILAANSSPTKHEKITPSSGANAGKLPKVSLKVVDLAGGALPYGKPLRIEVANGAFTSVTVHKSSGGVVAGALNKRRTTWHSTAALAPSSNLRATVKYVDLANHASKRTVAVKTPAAKHHFSAYLTPYGGATVGVGSVVSVTFDRDIPHSRRAAVESGLSVTASPAVVGAWHWMSDDTVHWRPPSYWKTGTKVTVSEDLQGVSLGHGVYGTVGRHNASFKIGASHISEVDQATETMKVYDNGKLIKTFPDSTGRGQYPTMDGVHVALDKSSVIQMDSATVGIPKGNPDYYDETVYWDVRISNGGEFVHAAPWSVGEQGHENVSHGCVNLSTANAEWFYNWAQLGDVVDIYNGVRAPESGDAGTADWNMSWKEWLAGDAAPTKAAKALHARDPRDYEPNFTPEAKAAAKHAASKKDASKKSASKHSATKKKTTKKSGSSY